MSPNSSALCSNVHDVDPRNGLSQRNLALHLFQLDDFDGAVRHAREAVRLTPNDPPAHNLLGLALIGQQKIDEAIDEFRASLALQPANNDAAGIAGVRDLKMVPNESLDAVFAATVAATEEAIVNAMVAARDMTGADGHRVIGLPHDRLREILRKYNRLMP